MIEQIKIKIKDIIQNKYENSNVIVEDGKILNIDISVPLFSISKIEKTNPKVIFDSLVDLLKLEEIENIEFLNGFLNIKLKRTLLANNLFKQLNNEKHNYGSSKINEEEIVVIDYSSPNIAKNFGVGHLRSTVIGNAIKNLFLKTGAKVYGINHLGDWGTQFGKMIVAYEMWGDEDKVNEDPINELQKLYIRFHDEEKDNPNLAQKGRDAFKKLEEQDEKYTKLWQWFREVSIKEFMRVYKMLDVNFDSYDGEAFYNDKMDIVLDILEEKNLLKIDDGATIVDLEEFNLQPALIKRQDGATLYMTRDLAALYYRIKTYNFTKALYVVGNEQKLHFNQLNEVSKLMGNKFDIEHIGFGLVMMDGKKMSSRGGKFKRLEDVINQAVIDAQLAIIEKNPSLANKDEVALAVGVGAIIFNDLKNDRNLNVDFNLEEMLKFEGQTGPYIQYSSVRIASILKDHQYDFNKADLSLFNLDHYYNVLKKISEFPSIIIRATETYQPSVLAKYLIQLAQDFNHFYGREKILVENEGALNTNLSLISAVRNVLNTGMDILGIKHLNEM